MKRANVIASPMASCTAARAAPTRRRRAVRFAYRACLLLIAALALPPSLRAEGNERIPTDNWSYAAVERFETQGFCTLPEDRPLSRSTFRRIVAAIHENTRDATLSARDHFDRGRLIREYGTDNAPAPDARYDRAWYARDGSLAVEGDVALVPYARQAPFADEMEYFLGFDPEIRLHFGDRVTYDVRYRTLMGPEHGDRARDQKPSRREKSFKGLTALFDRSNVVAAWDHVQLLVGREYVDWGPSPDGGLMVPGARYGIDQLSARVFFRNFRFDAFYGQLFPEPERYMIGHRLEGTFGRTVVGLSETVIYNGRGPDMVYALPLAWYYANQFNERTNDDNVVWSLDAKTTLVRHLTLFGSVLIDDLQFEREDGYPDKIAFDAGFRFVSVQPLGLALHGNYRRAGKYTFSHEDSLSVYVSGAGEIGGGDVLLGGEPGGDADLWRLAATVYPLAPLGVTAAVFAERAGESNPFQAFDLGSDDPTPPFPSGVVEKTTGFGLDARWDFDRNRSAALAWQHRSVDNRAHVSGASDDSDAFRLEIRWDFP
jgi:hypothetical protein